MNVRQIAARVQPGTVPHQRGSPPAPSQPSTRPGGRFAEALRQAAEPSTAEVKLSAHAEQRLQQRGISLNASERQALGTAMRLLETKGARDALLLRTDAAFIVNVPNRTVVTAVSADEMQQRTFTQIDSAMLL